jgi:hypothetical protein
LLPEFIGTADNIDLSGLSHDAIILDWSAAPPGDFWGIRAGPRWGRVYSHRPENNARVLDSFCGHESRCENLSSVSELRRWSSVRVYCGDDRRVKPGPMPGFIRPQLATLRTEVVQTAERPCLGQLELSTSARSIRAAATPRSRTTDTNANPLAASTIASSLPNSTAR